jgi:cholesterol transport system auxiliary component
MIGKRKLQALCTFAAVTLLAGCGNLLQSDGALPETYRLGSGSTPAAAPSAATGSATALGLTVVRPRAPAALDTDRIAVLDAGRRFDYYAGVRWAEPAPQMLQQNLVDALERSGRFAAVFAAPARVPAELMLDVELRRFEADASAGGAPVVHVLVQASLVDARQLSRVDSFTSEVAVPADGNRRAAIIAAFDRASAEVVRDVVAQASAAATKVPVN